MKKALIFVFFVLFGLLVLVLPVRSFQYVYRIYKEFKNPPPKPHEEIDPCGEKRDFISVEEGRLYNYVRLGTKCEER